ncbi:hypothetical protein AMAG_15824 [Allomyces macrogynus ATCC 38327]|uniref:G domain-containing protein n=1 Tax=Allomyces macrogynus (strain ATCC 38327) TaxID=578462 RepID=A0A0L0T9D8_ALLM3|nr:hypothetical protein AMAG_15824 [Allomyces macrogynus ATCC 38327]|eukprot:KNE71159.1 hypothetical protein AMAG_15824 [Allomyces macrogynus ATCC 38327]
MSSIFSSSASSSAAPLAIPTIPRAQMLRGAPVAKPVAAPLRAVIPVLGTTQAGKSTLINFLHEYCQQATPADLVLGNGVVSATKASRRYALRVPRREVVLTLNQPASKQTAAVQARARSLRALLAELGASLAPETRGEYLEQVEDLLQSRHLAMHVQPPQDVRLELEHYRHARAPRHGCRARPARRPRPSRQRACAPEAVGGPPDGARPT